MTSVHEQLKGATRASHERTERSFAGFDLTTHGGYRDFLRAQAAAFLPLEAAAEQAGIAGLVEDWDVRRRGPALRADLVQLDGPPVPHLSVPEGLDPLGIAYVLEGSRHGGKMMLSALADNPAAREAARFLGHSAGPGWWRRFVAVLEAEGRDRLPALLASAETAFSLFASGAAAVTRDATLGRSLPAGREP